MLQVASSSSLLTMNGANFPSEDSDTAQLATKPLNHQQIGRRGTLASLGLINAVTLFSQDPVDSRRKFLQLSRSTDSTLRKTEAPPEASVVPVPEMPAAISEAISMLQEPSAAAHHTAIDFSAVRNSKHQKNEEMALEQQSNKVLIEEAEDTNLEGLCQPQAKMAKIHKDGICATETFPSTLASFASSDIEKESDLTGQGSAISGETDKKSRGKNRLAATRYQTERPTRSAAAMAVVALADSAESSARRSSLLTRGSSKISFSSSSSSIMHSGPRSPLSERQQIALVMHLSTLEGQNKSTEFSTSSSSANFSGPQGDELKVRRRRRRKIKSSRIGDDFQVSSLPPLTEAGSADVDNSFESSLMTRLDEQLMRAETFLAHTAESRHIFCSSTSNSGIVPWSVEEERCFATLVVRHLKNFLLVSRDMPERPGELPGNGRRSRAECVDYYYREFKFRARKVSNARKLHMISDKDTGNEEKKNTSNDHKDKFSAETQTEKASGYKNICALENYMSLKERLADHKAEVEALDALNKSECSACGDGGDLLCCDTCSAAFHLDCLKPPLEAIPQGDWSCPKCVRRMTAKAVRAAARAERTMNDPHGGSATGDEGEEEEDDEEEDAISPSINPAMRLSTHRSSSNQLYDNHHRRMGICQLDDDGNVIQQFASQREAALAFGVSQSHISLIVRGIKSHRLSGLNISYAKDKSQQMAPTSASVLPSPPRESCKLPATPASLLCANIASSKQHGRQPKGYNATTETANSIPMVGKSVAKDNDDEDRESSGEDGTWLQSGRWSRGWIGKRAIRSGIDEKSGEHWEIEGQITGWLPKRFNDGIALWHVVHDDGDEEDLEENEAEEAIAAFEAKQITELSATAMVPKKRKIQSVGKKQGNKSVAKDHNSLDEKYHDQQTLLKALASSAASLASAAAEKQKAIEKERRQQQQFLHSPGSNHPYFGVCFDPEAATAVEAGISSITSSSSSSLDVPVSTRHLPWRACVYHSGGSSDAGMHASAEAAAVAYDKRVVQLGLLATKKLNFPLRQKEYLSSVGSRASPTKKAKKSSGGVATFATTAEKQNLPKADSRRSNKHWVAMSSAVVKVLRSNAFLKTSATDASRATKGKDLAIVVRAAIDAVQVGVRYKMSKPLMQQLLVESGVPESTASKLAYQTRQGGAIYEDWLAAFESGRFSTRAEGLPSAGLGPRKAADVDTTVGKSPSIVKSKIVVRPVKMSKISNKENPPTSNSKAMQSPILPTYGGAVNMSTKKKSKTSLSSSAAKK